MTHTGDLEDDLSWKIGKCLIRVTGNNMKKHAYLIMVHNEFHMLKKLLGELDDERNDIYLHVDKKTKFVDEEMISSWVHNACIYFANRMNIYWGTLSILRCELSLLEEAVKKNYAYYHLISGVDFPLKSQDYIHDYLENEDHEFISCHRDGDYGDNFFYKIKFYYPLMKIVGRGYFEGNRKKDKLLRKIAKAQYDITCFQKKHNFDRTRKYANTEFFKGDQWFTITHCFAMYILENKKKLVKMYRLTNGCDEIAICTLAMNSEFAQKVNGNSLRHIDWNRGGPYEFKLADLDELTNSEDFYARKISFNNEPLLVNRLTEKIHGEDEGVSKNLPLISIIVPCYNVADYLECCVESLVAQTYGNTEILLIDDGSTDSTDEIAKKFSDKYENVFYYYKENGGLSSARNSGIALSKGEYIAFVDSDDWVDPDFISKLYDAILEGCADIAVCGYHKEENDQDNVTFDENMVLSAHSAMKILGDIYPKENVLLVVAWNKLYKKSLFDDVRFCEGRIHEDECTAHRIIGESQSVSVITDSLYHYRIREGSITAAGNRQSIKHLDYLFAMKDRLEYVHGMMYGDLVIYMLYTYFESLKQLMVTYTDETIRKNRLDHYFRKEALLVYCRYFSELDGYQKKEYLKILINPNKYRAKVIKIMNAKEASQINSEP